ncbi:MULTISPECIES: SPFH domain-containing protein [Methylotuvimicrobium]|uniref:Band 7 protein n=2 Tax=Methylotuvimicrobium TaxID=2822410 RepID=G4T178_META2|nr:MULTISPECIES: SPFH domain-containing protein [Methylotuvimicrobium]QCW81637.1 Band 7 protein [Methylotuvimicrobium buryatense]CCE24611.1 Band 7 protein [Methylotuvimicrobium alcaliphilum 20Z]
MIQRKLLVVCILTSSVLAGCGSKVEVPSAHVGKIMTQYGFKEGIVNTSKFRLEPCWAYCDKLVVMNVSDIAKAEQMQLFMPKDKLNMAFDLRMTLAVKPEQYDELFSKIAPEQVGDVESIPLDKVYQTYAQQIIRSEAREFLSNYTIAEISSSREAINSELSAKLSKSIGERTPFLVRYVGLADIRYPEIIVKAQENAAERREMIQQEEAQLEISKVQLERKLQEQRMQRAIDVEKAEAEAEVNKILAQSVTNEYIRYRSLNVLDKMSESNNKVFIPMEMLGTIAGGVMLGKH